MRTHCKWTLILYKLSNMDDNDIVFKIIVIGQTYVGKSSMLVKYIKGQFNSEYNVTVGVEFNSKTVQINQKTSVMLQVWDTAGQETFKAIVRSFYKGIAAAFLVYSIDKVESFNALKSWVREVRQNAHQESFLFLVGSKLDLEEMRQVPKEKAMQFLREIGGAYFIEVSAKTGENIKQLFQKAARIMYKKYQASGSFRNLVRPALASGFIPSGMGDDIVERSPSFNLNKPNNKQSSQQKKKCC